MDWSAEPWASLVGFLTGEATQGEWQGEWKRARCSLSKLVTDGILHVQKMLHAGGGMHPPHPPPGSATDAVYYMGSTTAVGEIPPVIRSFEHWLRRRVP